MGTISHDVVIVVTTDRVSSDRLLQFSVTLPEGLGGIVLGPYRGVNGYKTFFWGSDGSNEGWADSTVADYWRKKFVALAKELRCDVVETRFGELGLTVRWAGRELHAD